jgi:ABC-type Fe3+-hydroxamate transport system substrate-binding protein
VKRLFAAVVIPALAFATVAPARAARVATLAPNLAELVCDAGACDQLVGISAYSDTPAGIARLPVVGDAFNVNLEALLAVHPGLVLAWRGGTPPEQIARIRNLGLRVEIPGADGLDGVAVALIQIGQWLDSSATADRAAAAYRARIDRLRGRWRDARKLRVVFEIGTQPFYTVSDKSPIGDAIRLCGGINAFGDLPEVAAVVTPESLVAVAPEVVIRGLDEPTNEVDRFWARLTTVPAVKSGAIYGVDTDLLSRATPRMADGIAAMCQAIDRARSTTAIK